MKHEYHLKKVAEGTWRFSYGPAFVDITAQELQEQGIDTMIEVITPEVGKKLKEQITKYAFQKLKDAYGIGKGKPKEETKEHQEEYKDPSQVSLQPKTAPTTITAPNTRLYPTVTKAPVDDVPSAPAQTPANACCTIQ